MKNTLRYAECAPLAEKIGTFLRSLGIDPKGVDGKNDPRADFLLALIAEMQPTRPGWVAISNGYFAVAENKHADPLLRLCAIARTHHLLTTDPVASGPEQAKAHRPLVEDCQRALLAAAFLLSSKHDDAGTNEKFIMQAFDPSQARRAE